MGKVEDYKNASPDGYKEHINWLPPSPIPEEEEKKLESVEIVAEAKALAAESAHKVHKAALA